MARAKPPVVRRGVEKSPLLSNQRIALRHSRRSGLVGQLAREGARILLSLLHMLLGALVTLSMLLLGVARKVPGWVIVGATVLATTTVAVSKAVYHGVVEWCTFSPQTPADPLSRREPRLADEFSSSDIRDRDDSMNEAEEDWEEEPRRVRKETSLADLDSWSDESGSWSDESGPWSMAMEQGLSRSQQWDKEDALQDSEISQAFESAKMASLDDEEKSLPEEQLQDQAAALRALAARGERWRS